MRACSLCRAEYDSAAEYCGACWFGGEVLAANMQPVVDLLCSATGTEWSAEHLGGGSFGLVTYLRVEGERPYIMVSAWPETMAGDSDPDAVESAGGWLIGGYGFDDDDLCLVPESGSASGLSTATVGPAVASLQAALLGDTPRVSAEASP